LRAFHLRPETMTFTIVAIYDSLLALSIRPLQRGVRFAKRDAISAPHKSRLEGFIEISRGKLARARERERGGERHEARKRTRSENKAPRASRRDLTHQRRGRRESVSISLSRSR